MSGFFQFSFSFQKCFVKTKPNKKKKETSHLVVTLENI